MTTDKKRPRDINQLAKFIVDRATGVVTTKPSETTPKNPAAVALGKKGGKARSDALTPEQRSEIARKAAKKRWDQ